MSEKSSEISRKRSESGKKGGAARALALSPEERSEISRKGTKARKKKPGPKRKAPEDRGAVLSFRVAQGALDQLEEIAEAVEEKRGHILARLIAKEHKRVMKS